MATENTTIREDEFVPMDLWGKDHWSTLGYIETKLVEGPCKVSFDARMRQNRRHYRVLMEARHHDGVPMSPQYGSRLNDGTYLPWHDDWCCVQDMIAAGLFKDGKWGKGFSLKLTDEGHIATAALRKHKIEGGGFSTFNINKSVTLDIQS